MCAPPNPEALWKWLQTPPPLPYPLLSVKNEWNTEGLGQLNKPNSGCTENDGKDRTENRLPQITRGVMYVVHMEALTILCLHQEKPQKRVLATKKNYFF